MVKNEAENHELTNEYVQSYQRWMKEERYVSDITESSADPEDGDQGGAQDSFKLISVDRLTRVINIVILPVVMKTLFLGLSIETFL